MRRKSNFRTTGISCLLSVLVAVSGAISPAQANASVPENGEYVCTTGALRAGGDTSAAYTITAGVVESGGSCVGAVVIPEGVREIGNDAFFEVTELTSISIPESVTKIGSWAFAGATGLASITIPSSVTSIGQEAFYGATGLSSISIPASVTSIGTWAICETAVTSITVDSANPNYASQGGVLFNKDLTTLIAYPSGNTSTSYVVPSSVTTIENSSFFKSLFLKSIAIPNSVTSILSYAFGASPNLETVTFASGSPITRIEGFTFVGLAKLNSITLPSNLEFIGEYVFGNNTSLTSITIPEGVTSIGSYAFNNASALTSITIPAAVTSIANNTFEGATSLAAIYVDPSNRTYSSIDGVLFNEGATTLIKYPAGKTQTSYTIPASVTRITPAFNSVNSLTSITIPASVATIEDNSFSVTPPLMDFYFLGDVPTNLGSDAFVGIASGARARISATAAGFGTDATWNGLEIVRAVPVPATGSYICTTGVLRASGDADPTYTISNGVVANGQNCAGAVVLPEGVASIANFAFRYASQLNSINIPSSVTSIGEGAFQASGLNSITFAPFSQLTRINSYAFANATSLTSINIPASVTHIESGAFSSTTSLTAVTLSSAITIIESEMFSNATALASIVIPASVTTIEESAFFDATALMDVNFSGNAPTNVGEDAFFGTASGAKANISATATGFGTQPTWNGLVVVRALPANGQYVCTTGVLRAGSDETSPTYTINNGVVANGGAYGGGNCAGAVVIPEGVTSITMNAFRNASSLSSITIPASVTTIEEGAFTSSGLTSITFAQESQLTTINGFAFSRTPLTSITIPASVQTPDYELADAFEDAYSLAAINVDPNNQTYSSIDGVLFNEGATTLVMYPVGKTETSYTIPSSVTTIFAGALYNVEALTSITIPSSVTIIEDWVFEDSSNLIDFNFLGNAPTDVDVDAFEGMSSGVKAHIKASATGFGAGNPWTWNGLIVQADLKEVTYNSAGGTPVTSVLFTQSGSIQTAPVSTRAGYTLTGWSATDNGSVLTFPYTPTGDITLHAIWTLTATPASPPSPQAPRANLTKMAEEARARAVEEAKTEIKSVVSSGKPLTVEQLLKADFKGVTTKNIGLINAEIAKLPNADKTDLKQIEKVVLKFAIVEKLAEGKTVYSLELIAVGLIPQDSKIKSSIIRALKKLPTSFLDTFEKIQAEIASVEKKHADRKARLATILDKKKR